jgi:hypothetical protein
MSPFWFGWPICCIRWLMGFCPRAPSHHGVLAVHLARMLLARCRRRLAEALHPGVLHLRPVGPQFKG